MSESETLKQMSPEKLAEWQAGWKPTTGHYILAEAEWKRRFLEEQHCLNEQLLEEQLRANHQLASDQASAAKRLHEKQVELSREIHHEQSALTREIHRKQSKLVILSIAATGIATVAAAALGAYLQARFQILQGSSQVSQPGIVQQPTVSLSATVLKNVSSVSPSKRNLKP